MTRSRPAAPVFAVAALALIAALGACQKDGGAGGSADAGPLPPGIHALASDARLQPPDRGSNCYSAPTRIVFHNQTEWNEFWTNEKRGCVAPPVPAGVDFGKDMLVYASMGKRMSADDRITIDGTGERNDTLLVFIRRSMQEAGCSGRDAVFPQSLVKIPASTKYVRFSEEHRKIPCGGTQP